MISWVVPIYNIMRVPIRKTTRYPRQTYTRGSSTTATGQMNDCAPRVTSSQSSQIVDPPAHRIRRPQNIIFRPEKHAFTEGRNNLLAITIINPMFIRTIRLVVVVVVVPCLLLL